MVLTHSDGEGFFLFSKLRLHTLLDALFSRVVRSAQDPIISALLLQDKLTAIKAHSILKYIHLFGNACAPCEHVHLEMEGWPLVEP